MLKRSGGLQYMQIVSGSSISALLCVMISTANSAIVTYNSYGRSTANLRQCQERFVLCCFCVRGCTFPVYEEEYFYTNIFIGPQLISPQKLGT